MAQLCIKTKDEFRLFMELNRRYSEISIDTDNGIDDESIMSIIGETVVKVSKEEFLKRPVKCIKALLRR
ncbi:hypothetical protein [Clostridium beijerinckii]|uniref:hypothetical protein n=1 Tax=Clostridium beijerinckii TaxID=1520 RepID=UPI0013003AB3|nr:hypothetical protein [Clostridium beijerinckii]